MKEKKDLSEQIESFTNKIAKPLSKFAAIPGVAAAIEGISANMNLIIIGGVFMILYVLSSAYATGTENAILPFLTPYGSNVSQVNSFTLGMIGLLASISIASKYAEKVKVDHTTSVVLSFVVFMILSNWGVVDGTLSTANFGSKGLIVAMFSSVLSIKVYKWFIDRKITIKLPASVPPAIANSFIALIPSFVIITFCWILRNLMNIDIVSVIYGLLGPVFDASETVPFAGLEGLLYSLFWSVGIHGGNMISPITQAVTNTFLSENAAALASGVSLTALPHWYNGARIGVTFINYWPLLIFMAFSKCKEFKVMAPAMIIPACFNITEPLFFGLPLILNPFLMIPYIITQVMTHLIFAVSAASGFIATKVAISVPWALPFPLQQLIGFSGDMKIFLVDILVLALCTLIWYPFWKTFEKKELEKEAQLEVR